MMSIQLYFWLILHMWQPQIESNTILLQYFACIAKCITELQLRVGGPYVLLSCMANICDVYTKCVYMSSSLNGGSVLQYFKHASMADLHDRVFIFT